MKRALVLLLMIVASYTAVFAAEDELDKISFPERVHGQKPVKEQVRIAIATYREMSETEVWDTKAFRDGHYRVINECPDTPWAIESCWRLSNLLITASGSIDQDEVIRLMELALDRYPGNPWQERFKNRLLVTLQDSGNHKLLLYWSQKFLESTAKDSKNYLSLCLIAGKAAQNSGEVQTAQYYFNEVISNSTDENSTFYRIARSYMRQ